MHTISNKLYYSAVDIIFKNRPATRELKKEILDSIYYARRIQRSLLLSEKYVERFLKILKPKNKKVNPFLLL